MAESHNQNSASIVAHPSSGGALMPAWFGVFPFELDLERALEHPWIWQLRKDLSWIAHLSDLFDDAMCQTCSLHMFLFQRELTVVRL